MLDHPVQHEDLQGARQEQRRQRLVLPASQGNRQTHTFVLESTFGERKSLINQ